MRELKQSTAANVMVFMVQSADHITGATGLTLTITSSKDGAAFGSISPSVTERGNGWYNLALTTSHTDTLGDLALHVTASGADPTDFVSRVITLDKAASGGKVPATIAAADVSGNLPANAVQIEGADATDTIDGRIDARLTAFGVSTLNAAGVRTAVGLASANLDTQLAAIDTETDKIASIKVKTDQFVFTGSFVQAQAKGIDDGLLTAAKFGTGAITKTAFASDAFDDIIITDGVLSTSLGAAIIDTQTDVDAIKTAVDTEVGAIKTTTDHLATALELNAGNYRFTTAALANAPTGGGDDVYAKAFQYGDVEVGGDGTYTFLDADDGTTPRLRFSPVASPGGRTVEKDPA